MAAPMRARAIQVERATLRRREHDGTSDDTRKPEDRIKTGGTGGLSASVQLRSMPKTRAGPPEADPCHPRLVKRSCDSKL
jgi:hypothetical protein